MSQKWSSPSKARSQSRSGRAMANRTPTLKPRRTVPPKILKSAAPNWEAYSPGHCAGRFSSPNVQIALIECLLQNATLWIFESLKVCYEWLSSFAVVHWWGSFAVLMPKIFCKHFKANLKRFDLQIAYPKYSCANTSFLSSLLDPFRALSAASLLLN